MLIEGISSSGHERAPTFWFGAPKEHLRCGLAADDGAKEEL